MPTSLFDPLSATCERVGNGWLGEPLNLLACVVYFIAAWLLWRDYQATRKAYDEERVVLIALIALAGLGNTFFSAVANRVSLYAVLLPMALFMGFFFYISLRRLLGLAVMPVRLLLAGIAFLSALTIYIPDPYRFNGSVGFAPLLITTALIAWRLRRMRHASATDFLKITGLLAAAILFRSLDMAVCVSLPTGTLFLCLICNGLALYLMAKSIRERRYDPR
jgi:hypothetical protein